MKGHVDVGGLNPRWVGSCQCGWTQYKVGIESCQLNPRWVESCQCGWTQSYVGRIMSMWVD